MDAKRLLFLLANFLKAVVCVMMLLLCCLAQQTLPVATQTYPCVSNDHLCSLFYEPWEGNSLLLVCFLQKRERYNEGVRRSPNSVCGFPGLCPSL